VQVAEYIHRAVEIAKDCRDNTPAPGKLKEFKQYLATEGEQREDIKQLRKEVQDLATSFPMPGV
jgi:glycine hydroxymethyltransferase